MLLITTPSHIANTAQQFSVDWAELITLDLGLYQQPGGKQELVKQLDHAVRHVGECLEYM